MLGAMPSRKAIYQTDDHVSDTAYRSTQSLQISWRVTWGNGAKMHVRCEDFGGVCGESYKVSLVNWADLLECKPY